MFLGIIFSIARCSMGNGAVAGAGSAANGDTTSPSARKIINQSVGAPVVTGERIPSPLDIICTIGM